MEVAGTSQSPHSRPMSAKKSSLPSFRLRNPSLNSLRLHRVFDIYDKNGDGIISLQELNQALSLLGLGSGLSELESTVKPYIKPGNWGLRFKDFAELHRALGERYFGHEVGEDISQEESDLWEAFKVFDEDGDGSIFLHELQAVLGKLGFPEGGKDIGRVERMTVPVDQNHDGRVDFSEFKNIMNCLFEKTSSIYIL